MKKKNVFKNVDAYCNLDLRPDGKIIKTLMSQRALNREGKTADLVLSDVVGSAPSNITPHMRNWFNSNIERLRKPALDEVNNILAKASPDSNVGGALLERKIDQITDNQVISKRKAQKQNQQQNTSQFSILEENKKSYEESRRMYDRRRMELRREPKMIGKLYWLMIAFVGVFELFINFAAFNGLEMTTQFTATGSVAIVAMLLALSSHYIGTFIKEFQFRFGDRSRDGDRGIAYRQLAMSMIGLFIVLGAVWYARADYLNGKILEASMMGGKPPSYISTIGGSLIQNLGVWVVGIIIAYMWHDSDPEFPELRKSRDYHSKNYRKLEQELSGKLEKEYRRIDNEAKNQITDAKHFDTSISHEAYFLEARNQFDRLSSQDATVIGMLQQYQSEFVEISAENETVIQIIDDANVSGKREITSSEFGSIQFSLKHV
jgi:hypothetical protein